VEAFQDEFTRQFLDSTKEVKPGFYLFRSGTNGYTMLFPENAILSDKFYEVDQNHFETIGIGASFGENISYFMNLRYLNKASFPVYIMHQSILLTLAFFILPLMFPQWFSIIIINLLSVLITFGLYEIIKRTRYIGILLYMPKSSF